MPAQVILNPYSGRGKAGRLRPRLERALKATGLKYKLVETAAPLEAIGLAADAAENGLSPIVAAGGDGLISEVINGLYRADPDQSLGPLGVVPLGTANDLTTNLGLPGEMDAAVETIAKGEALRIDLGLAGDWVFHNNSAVGLEPVVSIYNEQMVALRGVVRYMVAALRAILDGRSWQMEIDWDGGCYRGPTTLVSVGNNPVTGGLFQMAPDADPTDGKLTFVHAFAANRRRMLALLPRTINGSFVEDPNVHQYHCSQLQIRCNPATPLQVDGEVRSTSLTEISYRVLPLRLRILAPRPLSHG